MKRKKLDNGITLMILIITIVLLAILSVVTIKAISVEGILQKAKSSREKIGALEQVTQEKIEALSGESLIKQLKTTNHPNSTIAGDASQYNNPIIPNGYKIIETETASWLKDEGPEYNKGLVIEDNIGNQWVWVPVENTSEMYITTEVGAERTIGGTLEPNLGVKINVYSKLTQISGEGHYFGTIGSNLGREPDLSSIYFGYNASTRQQYKNVGYDFTASNYNQILTDIETPTQLAQLFADDYIGTKNSIEKYGGFYIGRYELTEQGVKKGNTTSGNWYSMYNKCRNLATTISVKTTMIWGCVWDETCRWLDSCGYSTGYVSGENSNSWGNNTNTGYPTGYSEDWKANNIYDFAGNYSEWTQEAEGFYTATYRMGRGGSIMQSTIKAASRASAYPSGPFVNRTTRAILYVK